MEREAYMREALALAREAAGRLVEAGLYTECYSDEHIYMANRVPLPTRHHKPGLNADGTVEFIDDAARLLTEGPKKARKLIVFTDKAADIEKARALLLSRDDLEGYLIYASRDNTMKHWASPGFNLR